MEPRASDFRLPTDLALDELVELFAAAERRLRALVEAAPDGDRRALVRLALLVLRDLRRKSPPLTRSTVGQAYALAARAVELLLGLPHAGPARTALGDALAKRLDAAAQVAAERTREAIRSATPETAEESAQLAVTGFVDAKGNRWSLTVYSSMTIETIGRQSLTFGTADRLGAAGEREVTVSSHGTKSEVCRPYEGNTYQLAEVRWPPYHARCKHRLLPAGYSLEQHRDALARAMAEAV